MSNDAARLLYDYELCDSEDSLRCMIREINSSGYVLIGVTQQGDTYTVFFGRSVNG